MLNISRTIYGQGQVAGNIINLTDLFLFNFVTVLPQIICSLWIICNFIYVDDHVIELDQLNKIGIYIKVHTTPSIKSESSIKICIW